MSLIRFLGRTALIGQLLFAAAALVFMAKGMAGGSTLSFLQHAVPALLWALAPHAMMVLPANGLLALQRNDATVATSVIALIALSLTVLLYGDVFFGTPMAIGTLAGWLRPLPFWAMVIALGAFLGMYRRPVTA